MKTQAVSGIDWNNIDLNSGYERDLNLIDPYDFDTLLLEVYSNIPVEKINRETVRQQAMESIKSKYRVAVEILESNLDNLVKYALKEKEDND